MNVVKSVIRIRPFIKKTPLQFNERLSEKYNSNIFLKREDLQITRSFKIRGACNKILKLKNNNRDLVCASAGNHAQGFAFVCNKFNKTGHIFLPVGTPKQKISRIISLGKDSINIILSGNNFTESLNCALDFSNSQNFEFVHPFDDYDIIEGQGTIASEIHEKIDPDIIISAVGGGGLISGLIQYRNYKMKNCLIYGVEPELANSMNLSLLNNKIIKLNNIDTFVDGASVSEVGKKTYEIVSNNVDKVIEICNGRLCSHIVDIYQEDGIILEPAGALSISSLDKIDRKLLKNKNIVCIVSGGNNDITRYSEILENKLIYDGLKHYFIIEFSQIPGQLKKFINNILNPTDDIVRFEYLKKTNKNYGNVLLGIQTIKSNDIEFIIDNLKKNNIKFIKINQNDLIYNYIV